MARTRQESRENFRRHSDDLLARAQDINRLIIEVQNGSIEKSEWFEKLEGEMCRLCHDSQKALDGLIQNVWRVMAE